MSILFNNHLWDYGEPCKFCGMTRTEIFAAFALPCPRARCVKTRLQTWQGWHALQMLQEPILPLRSARPRR